MTKATSPRLCVLLLPLLSAYAPPPLPSIAAQCKSLSSFQSSKLHKLVPPLPFALRLCVCALRPPARLLLSPLIPRLLCAFAPLPLVSARLLCVSLRLLLLAAALA